MPAKGHFKKGATKDSIRQRKYNSKKSQKIRRAKRNLHRRMAVKEGRVKRGDGREVDHVNRKAMHYGSTQIITRKRNRAKNSPIFS